MIIDVEKTLDKYSIPIFDKNSPENGHWEKTPQHNNGQIRQTPGKHNSQ